MTCELFAEIKFQAKTLATIEQANAILEEYAGQGFTLTLRQLFYQFVARSLIANTVEQYKRLGRTISDARKAALVDWDYIEDRTRDLESYVQWDGPADIISEAAKDYRENLWRHQPFRPEIWIEKAALIGVIEPACGRWRVPHMAARGYPSHSELYAAGKRLAAYAAAGQTPIILYLGDHDPSGLDMSRSLRDELSLYARRSIEVRRLALNLDQISRLRLPPNPAKESDSRYEHYVAETGQTDSWELDALNPTSIDIILEEAISNLVDDAAWQSALDSENEGRNQLQKLASDFGEASA